MNDPINAIAAATHINPYPYYAQLVAEQPLFFDATLDMWIASSAEAVLAVLHSALCRVRPPHEPVPRHLLASPAAELFQRLVRMNDGAKHCPFKQAITATFATINHEQVREISSYWASELAARSLSGEQPDALLRFALQLPIFVAGSLLGAPAEMLPAYANWIGDFVACLGATSRTQQIERGTQAAAHLLASVDALLAGQPQGMLATLAYEAARSGHDDRLTIAANAVGFLMQSYEATAGLIGNTLVALASRPDLEDAIRRDPALLHDTILEVLRYDPPIQNTRRFAAQDGLVAGRSMRAGDTILVVLAAANRDPLANRSPDRFEPRRSDRRSFSFGSGLHACPGDALAPLIAQAGVAALLAIGINAPQPVMYRPSANARIPMLDSRFG